MDGDGYWRLSGISVHVIANSHLPLFAFLEIEVLVSGLGS